MAHELGPHNSTGRQATNESHRFGWPTLECVADLRCNGEIITPEIHAKVGKGFFRDGADEQWTCYRRNYFSVDVGHEVHCAPGESLFLRVRGRDEQVKALGLKLTAAVDGNGGKAIELIQHTPKRDNGPKNSLKITKLSPAPPSARNETISHEHVYSIGLPPYHGSAIVAGPYLPFQNLPDDQPESSESESSEHQPSAPPSHPVNAPYTGHTPMGPPAPPTSQTFERLQFKQATANNGKRRASQQFFHLTVELYADIRKNPSDTPQWMKVATRQSEKIVVRGRSPSHYQDNSGNTNRGGNAHGGPGYGHGHGHGQAPGGGGFGGGYGGGHLGDMGPGMGPSGFDDGSYQANYRNFGGNTGPGATDFAGEAGDHLACSSPESDISDPLDAERGPAPQFIPEAGRPGTSATPGYGYYPGPLYDRVSQLLPRIGRSGSHSTDLRQYAYKSEMPDAIPGAQFQANSGLADKMQRFPSSHGWWPRPPANGSSGYS